MALKPLAPAVRLEVLLRAVRADAARAGSGGGHAAKVKQDGDSPIALCEDVFFALLASSEAGFNR